MPGVVLQVAAELLATWLDQHMITFAHFASTLEAHFPIIMSLPRPFNPAATSNQITAALSDIADRLYSDSSDAARPARLNALSTLGTLARAPCQTVCTPVSLGTSRVDLKARWCASTLGVACCFASQVIVHARDEAWAGAGRHPFRRLPPPGLCPGAL